MSSKPPVTSPFLSSLSQEIRDRKAAEWAAPSEKARRMELRGGVDTDNYADIAAEADREEEIVEFLVKEEETIVE